MVNSDSKPSRPYPADTKAKGWRFQLDYERINQSDTWTIATDDLRPWLLMIPFVAWQQVPCGSLPVGDALIARKLGMPLNLFKEHKDVLLRGWYELDDRLYHSTVTERVLEMLLCRKKDADRKGNQRANQRKRPEVVPWDNARTPVGVTTPEPEPERRPEQRKIAAPVGGSSAAIASDPHTVSKASFSEASLDSSTCARVKCPQKKIIELYHEILPHHPRVNSWESNSSKNLTNRWQGEPEHQSLDWWAEFFRGVDTNQWLKSLRTYPESLSWLVRPKNFRDVISTRDLPISRQHVFADAGAR